MAQNKNKVKKIKNYILIDEIGKGTFGKVFLATFENKTQQSIILAVKEMSLKEGPLSTEVGKKLVHREIQNAMQIKHQNVVEHKDVVTTENNVYLVMEYCSGGNLKDLKQQKGGKLDEAEARFYMQQLAQGLKAMYDLHIIHRDLKPENLLRSDKSINHKLKICDLGLSKNTATESCGNTLCGTRYYMAPEILQGRRKYDYKVDLWSSGVILYELVMGQRPFTGKFEYGLIQSIYSGPQFQNYATQPSPELQDLLYKLLDTNPETRIDLDGFLSHT